MAAAMGELLVYAENFYRRFPEEFLALGAPGLEEVFDLRAHGTKSRRILEGPTEKTVEITIRRWQAPPPFLGPPSAYALSGPSALQGPYVLPCTSPFQAPQAYHHPHHLGLPGGGCCGQPPLAPPSLPAAWPRPAWPQDLMTSPASLGAPLFGALGCTQLQPPASWPAPGAVEPPPAQPVGSSAETGVVTAQLARLESALELLKPQVEAALATCTTAAPAPAPAPALAPAPVPVQPATALATAAPAPAPAPAPAVSRPAPLQDLVISTGPRGGSGPEDELLSPPDSPLRNRRKLAGLSIVRPEKDVPKGAILRDVPVKEIGKGAATSSDAVPATKADARTQGSEGSSSCGGQSSGSQPAQQQAGQQAAQQARQQLDQQQAMARQNSKEQHRPRAVNAVRVAASIMDPESPRSPGKFSAWK